jgi:hypothetical protein
MNGFISSHKSRFTISLVTCLMGGFHYGLHFNDQTEITGLNESHYVQEVSKNKFNHTPVIIAKKSEFIEKLSSPEIKKMVQKARIEEPSVEAHNNVVAKNATSDTLEEFKQVNKLMHQDLITGMQQNIPNPEIEDASKQEVTILASSAASELGLPVLLENDLKKLMAKNKPDQLLAQVDFGAIPGMSSQSLDIQTDEETKGATETEVGSTLIDDKNESKTIGQKIENELLNDHIENQNASKETASIQNSEVKAEASEGVETHAEGAFTSSTETNSTGCTDIQNIKLIKPVDAINGETSQVCPVRKQWLSKNKKGHGWVKLDVEGHFSTLVHYPQKNSDRVLLLDQNSVAILAIKAGVHFSKDAGMIMGTVPEKHKVSYLGSNEEVQYIDIQSKKYFFILNLEPGAGVIELSSETHPSNSTTVFVPIIKESISYVDLAEPKKTNLKIRVKKEQSPAEDSEGLTVSVSTQNEIHAQTDPQGQAILKDVKYIDGYPIHIDVNSRVKGQKSYQYRYELTDIGKDGIHQIKQFSEKQIQNWMKQLKAKIYSQSGVIIGSFNRKGFKEHFYPRVSHLGEQELFKPKTMSILWDEKVSETDPFEGDHPRSLSVQVPEGLAQYNIVSESNKIIQSSLIPVSPRVINVISE